MKRNIACLLLAVLSIIILPLLFAQQNQNSQGPEIAALKKRISELESKLQTVENVEKMELAAKLADANAKLLNAEIDKYKRELKDANNEWLRTWSLWFVGILGFLVVVIGGAFWSWLRSRADQLIRNSVENRLDGFKEGIAQVDILKNQLEEAVEQVSLLQDQIRILNKEHAASVLERYRYYPPEGYVEEIKELKEQAILDVFSDETRHLEYRMKAAEVLANRESTKLVSSVLKCLNSYIDSDFDWDQDYQTQHLLCYLIDFIEPVNTTETYETLKRFLEQLLSDKPKVKRFIITSIMISLINANSELNKKNSVSVIRNAIPILNIQSDDEDALKNLVEYFNKFQEYEALKDILTNGLTKRMPEVEKRCLELLPEQYSDFIKGWKAQEETTNTQTEESE